LGTETRKKTGGSEKKKRDLQTGKIHMSRRRVPKKQKEITKQRGKKTSENKTPRPGLERGHWKKMKTPREAERLTRTFGHSSI